VSPLRYLCASAALSLLVFWGCDTAPGQPLEAAEKPAPKEVVAFDALYAENCAACHGEQGRGGAAIALDNPVYLGVVDDASMRTVIGNGVRGTSMPAFARSAGGMLTDEQIDVIAREIRSRWSWPDYLDGENPPSYAQPSTGNVQRGAVAYETYCASCHGPDGRGGSTASAITNDSFLALMSDQGLRTIVIAGRPELRAPDWRSYVKGKPMSDQEVTDVVAWLASHRVDAPGQPYSAPGDRQH
jgi:mono/diheme cytochrome c family protein